jgi:hypothetical protein
MDSDRSTSSYHAAAARPGGHAAPAAASGSTRADRAVLASIFAASVLPLLIATPSLMRRVVKPMDEGQLLTYPSLMLDGYRANSDFVYTYGVNNLWLLTGAFEIAGAELVVERSVGLLVRLVLVLVVTDLVRRTAGRWVALGAGLTSATLLASGGLAAFAWTSASTLALIGVWLAANLTLKRAWLSEALPWLACGLAIGFRVDIAMAAVAGVAAVHRLRTGKWVTPPTAAGLAIGCAPLVAHAITADNVIRDTIVSPILNGGGRRLPLVPQDRGLAIVAATVVLAATIVAATLVLRRDRRHDPRYWNLAGLGSVAVLTLPQMFQRLDIEHVQQVAPLILPAGVAATAFLVQTLPDRRGATAPLRPAVVAGLGLAVLALVIGVAAAVHPTASATAKWYLGRDVPTDTVTSGDRDVVASERLASDLEDLTGTVASLWSPGCDRLFVGPRDLRYSQYSDTHLYFLLPQFVPASRYLEFNPGDANGSGSPLADEIRTADLVVLTDEFDDLDGPNSSREPGPDEPNRVVDERFELVGEFGPWTLLATAGCVPAAAG